MVYGVQASLAFSSEARRDAVRADIETRVATRPRWGVTLIAQGVSRLGPNSLRIAMRFVSRLDAEDLIARVESFATGQRTPVAGSWLTIHDCSHDEGTNVCTNLVRRDW